MSNESALIGCQHLIEALEQCRAQGIMARLSGECTDLEKQVRLCRSACRAEDRKQHVLQAREKRKKVDEVFDRIRREEGRPPRANLLSSTLRDPSEQAASESGAPESTGTTN